MVSNYRLDLAQHKGCLMGSDRLLAVAGKADLAVLENSLRKDRLYYYHPCHEELPNQLIKT